MSSILGAFSRMDRSGTCIGVNEVKVGIDNGRTGELELPERSSFRGSD